MQNDLAFSVTVQEKKESAISWKYLREHSTTLTEVSCTKQGILKYVPDWRKQTVKSKHSRHELS